jgi:plastocyanin
MRKGLVIITVALALVGAACGKDSKTKSASGPAGPQTYAIDMDVDGPPQFQVAAYFPAAAIVRPGDTIVFENKAKGHGHTVTFGIKADSSNRPAAVTATGEESALPFSPCFTDQEATAALTSCPSPPNPAAPPAYAGKGYWSSGVLSRAGGPAFPSKITMKLADTIAPGDYRYQCMLHPFHVGTIRVAAKDAERLAPDAVRAAADRAITKAVADAAAIKTPAASPGTVTAGWGTRIIAVMSFDPGNITTKVGEAVTWKNASPFEPHTVTFQSPFKGPADKGATAPAGVKSGGAYTSGLTSSGVFGPPPFFPASTFSLTFTKPGTYPYVCTLHAGMAGVVTVT